ncbi:hypothetical protein LIER_20320 [Lithospermum erythrorhizon]|uniref:Uncharacterized protein n=1 Tax=Lithospermum erythrorhizon TaxID=34254 RepID=A0AAV3QL18_LITER
MAFVHSPFDVGLVSQMLGSILLCHYRIHHYLHSMTVHGEAGALCDWIAPDLAPPFLSPTPFVLAITAIVRLPQYRQVAGYVGLRGLGVAVERVHVASCSPDMF